MNPEWLLVAAVVAVGIFHTMVPDHWLPISVIARQQHWSDLETARAAAGAGLGHALSTIGIGLLIWIGGVAFALRFGQSVSLASSVALVAFGVLIALTGLRELREPEVAAAGETAKSGTALVLILGSSPMIEGLPAFFAAARFGPGLLVVMSVTFAVSTIATYVMLCVYSARWLRGLQLGPFERYGEIISGAVVATVGAAFLILSR